MHRRMFSSFTLLFILFSFVLLACDLGLVAASKPTAVIASPPSGSQFREGEDVAVQSTSTDSAGVVRVELSVDGNLVRTDPAPSPQVSYALIQTWKATAGSHTITVRAYNAANVASDPAAISITVVGTSATAVPSPAIPTIPPVPPVATSTTAPIPTAASLASPTPTTGAAACVNNSVFVADVTVPDGTVLAAGQPFNKIWRLINNGTCTWGNGYQFVFVAGEAMGTTTQIAVPNTAPGASGDLLIAMTAPTAPGLHTGQWRLKSPNGTLFGVTVTVNINVISTGGQSPPPSGTCSGTPNIESFTASPMTINAGNSTTLNWGVVTNAESVEIDQGIGGIAAPGSATVAPGTTTTYTMTARCGSNTKTAQVTVTVQLVGPPPTAPDLYVSEYTLTPATPVQGQSLHIRVGVYNQGSAAAGPFTVEWWSSTSAPSPAKTWTVDSLPKNGGQILEFDYTYASWYASITTRVKIDPANAVAEGNEGNNTSDKTIQVVANKPDLYVSAFTLTPNPPNHSMAVTVQVTVYNQGSAAATTPFVVEWYPGSNYPSPACTWTVNSMAAHGGQVLQCNKPAGTWASAYGSITTRVKVDSGNTVSESNEGNNIYDLNIKVN